MSLPDTNAIIRAYLITDSALVALVGTKINAGSVPENAILPAVGFATRGGLANPYIPDMPNPSVQFDCWANDPIVARNVYCKLYDALQGIQNVAVGSNYILSAIEEVHGQDLIDPDVPNLYRVLAFFSILIR